MKASGQKSSAVLDNTHYGLLSAMLLVNNPKNYRIIFTDTDIFNGRIIDREFSTKWMSAEEIEASPFLKKTSAKVVSR